MVSCSFAAYKTPEFDRRAIVYRQTNANAVARHFPIYCSYVAIYFAYDTFLRRRDSTWRALKTRAKYAYSMVYLKLLRDKAARAAKSRSPTVGPWA
jgi:hypothetical protein